MDLNQIYNTDALEGLKQLDENSIDAIISDPPYQLTYTKLYNGLYTFFLTEAARKISKGILQDYL